MKNKELIAMLGMFDPEDDVMVDSPSTEHPDYEIDSVYRVNMSHRDNTFQRKIFIGLKLDDT